MGSEAQTTQVTPPTTPTSPAAVMAGEVPAVSTPAAPVTPAAAAPEATTPAVSTERIPTRKLIGDDGDIPSDAELIEMKPSAFKKRLERSSRQQLVSHFGTDNIDDIKAKLDRFAVFEKEDNERKLAQMTETQRLQATLDEERNLRTTAEGKLKQIEETRIVETEDRRVTSIAEKFMNPKYLVTEIPRLAHFLGSCSAEELANPDAVIEEWFKTSLTEMPWLGKDWAAQQAAAVPAIGAEAGGTLPTTPPATPSARPVQMSNGAPPSNPTNQQAAVSTWAAKTAAPGKPNSMSASEWMEYKRQNGIQY